MRLSSNYLITAPELVMLDLPPYSDSYIVQYVASMEQELEAKRLRMKRLRSVGIKVLAVTIIVGIPATYLAGAIISPETVLPLVKEFLPDEWAAYLEENKVLIVYHAIMTITPIVTLGAPLALATTLSNSYSVRIFLFNSISSATQSLGGNPFLGQLFSTVAYSSMASLAQQSKTWLLAIKTDDELRERSVYKTYTQTLRIDQERARIMKMLMAGMTLKQIDLALDNTDNSGFWRAARRLLQKAASATGQFVMRHKFTAIAVLLIGALYLKFQEWMDPLFGATFPYLISGLKLVTNIGQVVYGFVNGHVSWDDVLSSIKKFYPPYAIASQLQRVLVNRAFPWLLLKLMTVLNTPQLMKGFLERFPGMKTKVGDVVFIRSLRKILSSYYQNEIQWGVPISSS